MNPAQEQFSLNRAASSKFLSVFVKPFKILCVTVLTLLGCLAPQLWAQELFVRGLCYSPFRDGQSPVTGVYPTLKQIMEDLRILRPFTPAIRSYGLSSTQSLIPALARANGLQCYAGAWIDTNLVSNAREIDKLKRIARNGQATAYVCEKNVCKLPTSDPEVFARQLQSASP